MPTRASWVNQGLNRNDPRLNENGLWRWYRYHQEYKNKTNIYLIEKLQNKKKKRKLLQDYTFKYREKKTKSNHFLYYIIFEKFTSTVLKKIILGYNKNNIYIPLSFKSNKGLSSCLWSWRVSWVRVRTRVNNSS